MPNREIDLLQRIKALRKEYQSGFVLSEDVVNANPLAQFGSWFDMAVKAGLLEPNAMALATTGSDGKPSLRMLLMKEYSEEGFFFYTNYHSRKGRELETNSYAAILFFWAPLERQVRIEGKVEKISREKTEKYFSTRPRGSQIGAAASSQSRTIESRLVLEEQARALDLRHQSDSIPCPEHWGGYVLRPDYYEYWQGQENRLHDRLSYRATENGWKIERLSP